MKIAIARHGAIGDMVWCTPLIRQLHDDGHDVHVYTGWAGREVLKHNPKCTVHETKVPEDWKKFIENLHGFDRIIDLVGSVENKLIYHQNSSMARKSDEERRDGVEDIDYIQATLDHAKVKSDNLKPELFFSTKEKQWAKKIRRQNKNKFIILWSLSGSSIHKTNPWCDDVAAYLNDKYKDIHIVTVGDQMCRLLEWDLPNTDRKSTKWKLRQSLIMTKEADMVVGPETGILNAASCYDTPKAMMLTHTGPGNRGDYWENADFLEGTCKCHPCYNLVNNDKIDQFCTRGEYGGALCMEQITPDIIIKSIEKYYRKWRDAKRNKNKSS